MTMARLKKFIDIITYLAIFMVGLALVLSVVSCSPKTIYVPDVHYEYITKTDTFIKIDSVNIKDSIYVTQKGDTVRIERWRVEYRDRWREKIVRDTIIRTDTISVPYPVEKKLTIKERFDMYLGFMWKFIAVLLVLIAGYVFVKWKKGNILGS